MELVDIRLEVRERVGELTADFFTNVEVDRAINDGLRRFASEEPWPFLLTEWETTLDTEDDGTGAALQTLELPADASITRTFNLAIDGGSLAHPRILERVDPREGWALRFQYEDTTSAPRWYYIAKSNLNDDNEPPITYTARLVPPPDAAYTVTALYFMTPAILSGDSEEPGIPTEYHEAIPAWAAGKLFLKEHAVSQKASEQFQLYHKVLEQARKDLKAFNLDETVAWGRREPLAGYWAQSMDPRFRMHPTLGG